VGVREEIGTHCFDWSEAGAGSLVLWFVA